MDFSNGKFYDKINTKIEKEFYETEGINQIKFRRDSIIKLELRKIRKYKILDKLKSNNSEKYLKKNNQNNYLIKQYNLNKLNFLTKIKLNLKLTPFQKFIKKSNLEKKKLKFLQLSNIPTKELDFVIRNSSYENTQNLTSLSKNKSNPNILRTPSKHILSNPFYTYRKDFSPEHSKNKELKEFFLSNLNTIKSHKLLFNNKINVKSLGTPNKKLQDKNTYYINDNKNRIQNLYLSKLK